MIQILTFMGCGAGMILIGIGLGVILDWWDDGAPHEPTDIEYY